MDGGQHTPHPGLQVADDSHSHSGNRQMSTFRLLPFISANKRMIFAQMVSLPAMPALLLGGVLSR